MDAALVRNARATTIDQVNRALNALGAPQAWPSEAPPGRYQEATGVDEPYH